MINEKIKESRAKRGRKLGIKNPIDYLAVFLATGFGAGFIPWGPGTFGSLVGLLITYGLILCFGSEVIMLQNSIIIAATAFAAIGLWAGDRAEIIFDKKDAGQIVIDEVCGQIMTFAFIAPYLPRIGSQWRWWTIAGFILFRAFDIFKPYPIKKLQDLRGGFGVLMDDVLAAIYAAALLSLLMALAV